MEQVRPVLVIGHRRPEHVAVDLGESFSATRIEWVLGIRRGCLLRAVDACNLLGPHDEQSNPRTRAAASLVDLSQREVALLLGCEVHRAFRLGEQPTLADPDGAGEVYYVRGCRVLLVPHPSGRNRTWNDVETLRRVAAAVQSVTSQHIEARLLRENAEEARRAAAVALRAREWQPAYLDALSKIGVKTLAAQHARISRDSVQKAMLRDPEFARQCALALDACADRFEAEAIRRAIQGTKRPIYQGGQQVGEEVLYSDAILMRLLAAVRPEKWSERRRTALTGPRDDEPVTMRALLEEFRRETGEVVDGEVVDAQAAVDGEQAAIGPGDVDGGEPEHATAPPDDDDPEAA